jgi:type I restriction enzyme S subunit
MTIKHWEKLQLREAATKVGSGATPTGGKEAYHTSGIPLIRSQNVRFEGFTEDGVVFLDARQAASLDNAIVCKNDILLNITGASIGRVTLAPPYMDGARVNQHVTIIRLKDQIDQSFVRWFIASPSQQRQINSIQVGVTRQALTKDMVLSFELPLPPFGEQRRIVSKIEELFSDLDAGVAALKRAKANLKRYRASVLKSAVEGKLTEQWRAKHPAKEPASALLARILLERRQKWEADQLAKFAAAKKEPPKNWRDKYVEPIPPDTTELPELPEGWCWASVEQTSEVQGGIQKQPKRAPGANSFPFLRVANVHRNQLELDEIHRIELFGNEIERLRLQTGDLLVVEGNGSKTEIGRSAIWTGEIEDCVHQNHIIRVRFLAGSSRYLNSYWNSPSGNGRVMEQAASTSGLYTLSVTKVCSLPVPLAPIVEQEQIVAEVEERLSVISAAEIEISNSLLRAARLRQSILKRAFEGKLVPQDPKDEPASALLERLRASRTIHEGSGNRPSSSIPRRSKSRGKKS